MSVPPSTFPPITRAEIHNNYTVSSNFVRTLVKSDSLSEQEFELKYLIFERMMAKHTLYGRLAVVGTFGLLTTYFFKGYSAKMKVLSGFLFILWQPHIYTLGSHIGVYTNLKWAFNELLFDERTQCAQLTQKFILRLRDRDNLRNKGSTWQSDSSLMEEFYKELIGKHGEKIFDKSHSYVSNRYFIENKEKYMANNQENNPVLFSKNELSTEERLQLPYLDSFLTRYVYHNMKRWFIRVGQYLRVIQE